MAEVKVNHGIKMEPNRAVLMVNSEEALNDSDKTFTIPGATDPSTTQAEVWHIFNIRIEFTAVAGGGTRKFTVVVSNVRSSVRGTVSFCSVRFSGCWM